MTLKKDKEDQSKYYLSYPKPPVTDKKWKNRDINVIEWANNPKFPFYLMEIRTKRCSAADGMLNAKCLSVKSEIFMDYYFTSLGLLTHLLVNKIRATRVLNKNRLRKYTIIGDKKLKKECGSPHQP